ncbi:Asp-tRNA(Asn)/Glu-tRNA(Gln) amidotransferase subunit GatB [Luteococcus japonicus]|uniref:Aspartyl/glutamyl-tRNA(Asn/Gln) amidotransferase subunit B n=1 Tax=Luteococcus japonicus LSP_Lj1 TaxID=1255658 RepID=A0A1R4JLA3_9ACTN|nr:Asp-tRNA(Asn)/Glu-tRNA(Gln) amidotransferase subunit GatB [Luteococcus japonicus]SJN32724.1 Aspartyl-tRNA(Asn) amidotransferase subunit B amidotransferase subunit B [Luteococcus japonicus LSP_Lj1]
MSDELLDYDDVMDRYDSVLGLEVHVELNTASKMWCGCATTPGAEPNTQTCPVCLGLPGSLPVVNGKAVESAIRIGLALNCQIAEWCRFARKNYFYPDMAKDYQISQSDEPICFDGHVDLEVEGKTYRIEIERVHMEEDAGKLTHQGGAGRIQGADYSLVDYNRAGMPLMEIVTRPIQGLGDKAPEVGRAYMSHLRDLMRALGVSEAKMEQGNMRCDANVSLMPKGSTELGTRTETKNVNSLKSVEGALRFEIRRQGAVLEAGGKVKQETRHWRETDQTTSSGRSKEQAEDYRYFPEPDLVPVAPSREWVEELRATLPEPPAERRARLQQAWGFTGLEMRDIFGSEGALDLIDATVAAGSSAAAAKKWWIGELARRANEAGVALDELSITPAQVAAVQQLVEAKTITDKLAREVFEGVLAGEGEPAEVVEKRGLAMVQDDGALSTAVDAVIEANPDVAQKIRDGKVQAAGALIGQVMKAMKGKADAARVRELLLEKLS